MRPSFVSDETCFAVLGIVARKFRERIVPECERVTRIGHTVVVELSEAERAMRELGATTEAEGTEQDQGEDDDDQPTSVDDVLRRIGKERIA